MTIYDFKNNAVQELKTITENPSFEAEQLLINILGVSRNDLILQRKHEIPDDKLSALLNALERRKNREPLQYICGEWEFFGLRMFCGKGCLIPRPETEMLAEYAIKSLPKGGHLLDLCTGSGCIAVAVLSSRPDVTATALDISEDALYYAKKNAEYHGIGKDRINFVCKSIFDFLPEKAPDCIVSNPPYIKSADIETLSPEVKHEPVIALDGGEDGLVFYRNIAEKFYNCLKNNAEIYMEVGYDIFSEVSAVFTENKYSVQIFPDTFGVNRVCAAKKIQ